MTKLSSAGKRSFTVIGAFHADGAPTKFHSNSRLISATPSRAAPKAFTELCNLKKIKGLCTLYITIRETTQGSNKKEYTYKCSRSKLTTPIKLAGRVIEYGNSVHASNVPRGAKSHKSSGRMRSISRRQTKKH